MKTFGEEGYQITDAGRYAEEFAFCLTGNRNYWQAFTFILSKDESLC